MSVLITGCTAGQRDGNTEDERVTSEADAAAESADAAAPEEQTMKIYDIDDGYIDVPYYEDLPQNDYDWTYLNKKGGYLHYDAPEYNTAAGIDVSKFSGDIDWKKVKADGIDFVMIRAGYRGYTEGNLKEDERFDEYADGAAEAGIDIGVYFLSQAVNKDEADEEAVFLYDIIKDHDIRYPVVVDSEKIKTGTARTVSLDNAQMTDTVIELCRKISEYGYSPMIYANSAWLTTRLDIRKLADIDIWYADYQYIDNQETPLYRYPFKMWQYTNKGHVDGIDGDVDLNILFSNGSAGSSYRIITQNEISADCIDIYLKHYGSSGNFCRTYLNDDSTEHFRLYYNEDKDEGCGILSEYGETRFFLFEGHEDSDWNGYEDFAVYGKLDEIRSASDNFADGTSTDRGYVKNYTEEYSYDKKGRLVSMNGMADLVDESDTLLGRESVYYYIFKYRDDGSVEWRNADNLRSTSMGYETYFDEQGREIYTINSGTGGHSCYYYLYDGTKNRPSYGLNEYMGSSETFDFIRYR